MLQTSDVAGASLVSWLLPSELLFRLKQTSKLSGSFMYRGDIEITFKVNGTRFQQGRYFLRVVYTGGDSISIASNKLVGAHMANLMTQTSAHCYEIDIATETSVTFTIPYTSVANYCLTDYSSTLAHDFARLYLVPYSPLQAGSGDTTCQWSCWARFIDISIAGAVKLQSKTVSLREAKKAGVGPVSSVADKVAQTASVIGEVPMLSMVASTVSWLADLTKRAAVIWGFSKPAAVHPPQSVYRQAVPFTAVSDGANVAHKMSLFSTNEVPLSTGRSRTAVDELSLDYLLRQYSWISTVAWSDTATTGTVLANFNVALGPNVNYVSFGVGSTLPVCDYVSTLFQAYRASIRYRIKIPKTEFHSGRLAIYWQPFNGVSGPPTISDLASTDNVQRVIWDLRESNEIEVEIPWISAQNFHPINQAYAVLGIMVVNELIAPSTVPSTVHLLVEKSVGSEYDFGKPIAVPTSNVYHEPFLHFQSGKIVLGSGKYTPIVAAESFGESVRSLRSLLKRFSPITVFNDGVSTGFSISPFEFPLPAQTVGAGGPIERVSTYVDYMTYLAPLYAMNSGGVRVISNIASSSGNSVVTAVNIPSTTRNFGAIGVPGANDDVMAPAIVFSGPVEGFPSVELPQMSFYGGRSVANSISGSSAVFSSVAQASHGGSNVALKTIFPSEVNFAWGPVTIFRAAAEDFNFSCYNGVVPVILSNTA